MCLTVESLRTDNGRLEDGAAAEPGQERTSSGALVLLWVVEDPQPSADLFSGDLSTLRWLR